ncbi:hypothetical protein ACPCG0_03320 [Propionibacteriaceae bacterium Y1923]
MDDLIPTAQLRLQGLGNREISRRVSAGELTRVLRGHYLCSVPDEQALHLQRALSCPDQVLALESAALVHGLPISQLPELVQVIMHGAGRSRTRGVKRVTSAPLPAAHITEVNGARLTTVARTVVDITRTRGLEPGLVAWEAARWRAREAKLLDRFDAETGEAIELLSGRRGVQRARIALASASSRSQSPMETRSLIRIRELRLPTPVQQYSVVDQDGSWLGTTDFAWPELGVLGEYDGQDKYDSLARPGETPVQVMRREKRRQESMEAVGWVFARWGKEEVRRPAALRARIEAAMKVAASRVGRPLPGVER